MYITLASRDGTLETVGGINTNNDIRWYFRAAV